MYLFYPPAYSPSFPFIQSIPINFNRLPVWAAFHKGKFTEDVHFGILPTIPVLWMLIIQIPASILIRIKECKRKGSEERSKTDGRAERRQITAVMALVGLVQFAFLLFYYYGAMRFNVDYYLPLLLVVFFLALELDEQLRQSIVWRSAFWLSTALLVCGTAVIAFLAGFDIPPQIFRIYNPSGYNAIADRGNQIFAAINLLPDDPGVIGVVIRAIMHMVSLQ